MTITFVAADGHGRLRLAGSRRASPAERHLVVIEPAARIDARRPGGRPSRDADPRCRRPLRSSTRLEAPADSVTPAARTVNARHRGPRRGEGGSASGPPRRRAGSGARSALLPRRRRSWRGCPVLRPCRGGAHGAARRARPVLQPELARARADDRRLQGDDGRSIAATSTTARGLDARPRECGHPVERRFLVGVEVAPSPQPITS